MQSPTTFRETEILAQFAGDLAEVTDAMAMSYFRKSLEVEHKADASPVTQADRAIEAAMRERINSRFPTHGILGEEHEDARLDAEQVWVLDPIDGTKSFMTGMPTFGTLIACLSGGRPEVGVISIPPTGERWMGVRGRTTTLNGEPCRASGRVALAEATLYTTTPDTFDSAGHAKFEALSAKVGMRRFGGDCYAYGLLASGHVDIVFEMNLHPYDYLALVPVVEGAGGVITDWNGKSLSLQSDGRVIAAASAELHRSALAALA
ncbi:Inositol monophosphatase family protein [Pseudooceanicola batsensis HTCC2597]|uniref:Histidinol-phosphatase n=1 Tax=Pseudooceanicola batsensis (strain ATCC BAA-863 / DSM 15984 / KCTC 12145 / HTCC2597) TaxID=252305 RepID=A3U1G5_PSEBH|nr:histidinol-phosphatase [Pseudooceanicola batsensis]EAQ02148.1 Inositol monophosphatase family protein [Pseudooceanicola batsensis HTCC2597]